MIQRLIERVLRMPAAVLIVALAVVPGALLGLWFDRERGARTRPT